MYGPNQAILMFNVRELLRWDFLSSQTFLKILIQPFEKKYYLPAAAEMIAMRSARLIDENVAILIIKTTIS